MILLLRRILSQAEIHAAVKATIEANATPTKAAKAPKKKKKSTTDDEDDGDDEDVKPSKKAKKAVSSLGTLNEEGEDEDEDGVVDPIRVKYQSMKNDDLKDYCRWNNLNLTGTKV